MPKGFASSHSRFIRESLVDSVHALLHRESLLACEAWRVKTLKIIQVVNGITALSVC